MSTAATKKAPAAEDATPKVKRKDKKNKVVVSLYVNGIPYEYGCKCTFCQKEKAILHCPECPDFYCENCDYTTHLTEKRKGHVRKKLSHLSLKTASRLVKLAVRYHIGVLFLQKQARKYIRRFFDVKTLCHYYYNTKSRTTSWRKPYCLRKEELFPFLTPETAAERIQGLYRMRVARNRVVALVVGYFKKIFSRAKGANSFLHFYI
jgi:hypothetical protein